MNENNEISSTLKWKYPASYIFAILSWTTGLMNIFYNPKLLLEIGLFNYLLIYILIMVVIGIPMTLKELAISQYSLKSVVRCWDLCPFFRGVGYAKFILIVIFQVYYNVLNSYVLFYCITPIPKYRDYKLCEPVLQNNCSILGTNSTFLTNSEKFWYTEVVPSDEDTNIFGLANWKLMISLVGHMIMVFIFNAKRTQFLEKLLPLSFNFSILESLILLCVTNAAKGGLEGFRYVIFKKINLNIFLMWKKEGMLLKVFQNYLYSIGLALGGFSNIAAMDTFRKPAYAMSIWSNLANLGTTLIYSFIFVNLYGVLHFHNPKIKLENLIKYKNLKYDFSYIFTIFPEAIIYLPGLPQLWKIIFYSSIYFKGLCTSSIMAATVLNTIYEENPNLVSNKQLWTLLFTTFIGALGCLFHTKFGPIVSQFISNLTSEVLLPIILTCEVIAVVFVYGLLRFMKDLHFMLGTYPKVYWPLCLALSMIIVPIFTSISIIFYFKYTSMTELETAFLKTILSVTLVWIPFMGMVRIIRKAKFTVIFKSAKNWGPANGLKNSRKMFEQQHSIEEFLYEKYLLERKLKKYE